MKFAYEDLSDDQFEGLIVLLCQHLLGISTQGFAKGPDGGRDAKFVGTAELYPSKVAPWVGTVIIQAKHTNGCNRSFSESDFFSTSSSKTVISEEIPRIKKLRDAKQLDHYMLFANRRLTGNAETKIREHIADRCGLSVESICLCGLEQLEWWLKQFPKVPQMANLDMIDSPLIVSPDDLAEVVQALAHGIESLKDFPNKPPDIRVTYEQKNALNNMTEEYAKELRRKYLKETSQIHTFLAAPENIELLGLYESVIDEFQLKIIASRKDYQTFDRVMEYLINLLFNRDPILRAHKRLTRAMLFYMYWNCDIGEVGDATSNQALSS